MSNERSTERAFVIGGHRVVFVRGDGWRCTCELWKESQNCTHVNLAAALATLEHAVIATGGSIRRH
jgi:hypothetical protein